MAVTVENGVCRDEPLSKLNEINGDDDDDDYSNSVDQRNSSAIAETSSTEKEMNRDDRLLTRNSSVPNSSSEEKSRWRGRRYSLVQALSNPLTRLLDEPYDGRKKFHYTTLPAHQSAVVDSPKRLAIINEMVNCEKDYVALLTALVEEFLRPARSRRDLFDADLISAIFCNVEKLRGAHQTFLSDLELSLTWKPVCIGPSFLKHACAFEIYSYYCNNHQRSCQRLIRLYNSESHLQFFEECRIAGRLPPLRLDGFLLRPVQHLCRYPVLLAELFRLTPSTHPDHCHCSAALQRMRNLLSTINGKRRLLEEMVELVRWQKSVLSWHGPDILRTSCRLMHSGELSFSCWTKTGVRRWNKRSVVFLFDHLLVICRKDRLKKNLFFKVRVSLDNALMEQIDSESWELNLPCECKRFLFKANNRETCAQWLEAFNRERLFRTTVDSPGQNERQLAVDSAEIDVRP